MVKFRIFNLRDIEEEAREILELARKKARDILQEAIQRAESIKNQAEDMRKDARDHGYKEGYEQGLKKGLEDGLKQANQSERERIQKETSSLVLALEKILEDLSQQKEDILRQFKEDLLKLVILLAEKVIKGKICDNPRDIMIKNLSEAMKFLGKKEKVKIIVNPEDLRAVEEYLPQLKGLHMELGDVELLAGDILRGGCVLETKEATIDARIETQLEELAKLILEG
jgi:flagellar assembly protein FliH